MPLIAGVEEAGRGPVIGPMVMAIAVIDSTKESFLREIGVKDSKELTKKQREVLFKQLTEVLPAFHYTIIEPKKIDEYLRTGGLNLNRLEADTTVDLIKKIGNYDIDEIFIDCPSTNIKRYVSYLNKYLKLKPRCLIAEHKADQTYPIVSAASIIAKVIRDRRIEKIHQQYNVDLGSGYTSDSKTIAFLRDWIKNHKDLPDFVRKKWVTAKNILYEKSQKKLDAFF